jgi:hypothetical protein
MAARLNTSISPRCAVKISRYSDAIFILGGFRVNRGQERETPSGLAPAAEGKSVNLL